MFQGLALADLTNFPRRDFWMVKKCRRLAGRTEFGQVITWRHSGIADANAVSYSLDSDRAAPCRRFWRSMAASRSMTRKANQCQAADSRSLFNIRTNQNYLIRASKACELLFRQSSILSD